MSKNRRTDSGIEIGGQSALRAHNGEARGTFWIGHAIGVDLQTGEDPDRNQCFIIAATPGDAARFARQMAIMPIDAMGAQRVAICSADNLRLENDEIAPSFVRPACEWRRDEFGAFDTGCGHVFNFVEGGPADNGTKFCQYCGGSVIDVSGRDD